MTMERTHSLVAMASGESLVKLGKMLSGIAACMDVKGDIKMMV